MTNITLYTTPNCSYCHSAKALLASKGLSVTEINVQAQPEQLQVMMTRSGRRSVPQIFFGDVHIGGFDDLAKLDRQGQLMAMLA